MQEKSVDVAKIPEWYLATFQVLTHVDGYLRNIDIEVGHAMELEGIEEHVCSELRLLRDSLAVYKGHVAFLEMTARETLDGILNEAA